MDSTFGKILQAYSMDVGSDFQRASDMYNDIISETDLESSPTYTLGALLFGLAEHARISRSGSLVTGNMTFVEGAAGRLLKEWSTPCPTVFGEYEAYVNTSNLGIIYGGLASVNRYLKREDITLCTREIKDHVFKNNIAGNMLVSNTGRIVSYDIILSCVPFGMFSPEDLVLVEAISDLERQPLNDSLSALLLSWYYKEKGEPARSIKYLEYAKAGQDDHAGKAIASIIRKSLKDAGEMNEGIKHLPYGTGNRYSISNFERTPHDPKEGERVIIRAMARPADNDMDICLHYSVNGGKENLITGRRIKSEDSYWEWEIGPFMKSDAVSYYITANDGKLRTEDYSFNVWGKRSATVLTGISQEKGNIRLMTADSEGRDCPSLYIEPQDGLFKISFGEKPGIKEDMFFIEEKDYSYILRGSDATLELYKNPFAIRVCNKGRVILETVKNDWLTWYEDENGIVREIRCAFNATEDERYYGFGERYNSLNQKGNKPDVYVYNEYKNQGIRTYIPVPYFLSSNGYGIYIDTPCYTEFDMAYSSHDVWRFLADESELRLYIMTGKPKDAIGRFSDIVGKPSLLPKWAFGPWMSSNNWDNEETVREQVELTMRNDIPATVLVIEAWSDEATFYIFNDAVYNENNGENGFEYKDFRFSKKGRWPGPKELIDYLHKNGLKCILWQIPVIKNIKGIRHLQNDADEEYAIVHGYCVKNPDGTPYRIPEGWFKDSLVLDFTNQEASTWWFSKRRYLVEELKVDGFKTDGGEFIFGDGLKFFNGKTGKEMRNLYPNEYIGEYYRFVNRLNPDGGMTFSRAGFTGAQRYPAHWAGDENSTFRAFKSSIIAGLTAGISGIPFWGWDLAGFSGDIPSAELYIRSAQMAALCPIMQYHAESKGEYNQDRTPWNIAKRTGEIKALELYRYYAKLRMSILPYIYNEAIKSSKTGLPLMRAMFIEYPEDEKCRDIQDQYMFGDSILVAPITEEGRYGRNLYLPHGKWIDFWNGSIYDGDREIYADAPIEKIPLFIRYNSIIPINLNHDFEIDITAADGLTGYKNLCFYVFGDRIDDFTFKDDLKNTISFSADDKKMFIQTQSKQNFYIITKQTDTSIYLNGEKLLAERRIVKDKFYAYKLR